MTVEVIHGDCLEVLSGVDANSFDSCVTDPPYGLAFMSKRWDKGGRQFTSDLWSEVLRVLKPGAHLLVFGGTRTYHRTAVAIEDAGFEIRDSIHWCYGSGFPKSLNIRLAIDKADGLKEKRAKDKGGTYVTGAPNSEAIKLSVTRGATEKSRAWDGWGSALKPSHEPIIVARKPLNGTLISNVLEHGTGGLNIDACRVSTDWSERPASWHASGNSAKPDADKIAAPPGDGIQCHPGGRWPANTLLTHNHDCSGDWCTDGCPVRVLGEQSGDTGNSLRSTRKHQAGGQFGWLAGNGPGHNDSGTAARYFHQSRFTDEDFPQFYYCAKAGTAERDAGLEAFRSLTGAEVTNSKDGQARLESPRTGAGRNGGRKNPHPTVKPIELMRYLVRLVTPPGGHVLDPFGGSGTTGVSCALEGFKATLIELNDTEKEPYVSIARARIKHAQESTQGRQVSLFELLNEPA